MKTQIANLLTDYTGHQNIKLTSRGNMAIFIALHFARKCSDRKLVLFPDQGGWLTYKTYPSILSLQTLEVATDYAKIDLDDLRMKAKSACAFIYSNPGGYIVEQQIRTIYEICNNYGCQVILDVSGAIGKKEWCCGEYADYIVGSFGEWKPANAEYGGFISAKKPFIEQEIFSIMKICEDKLPLIFNKLQKAPSRIENFIKISDQVKKELESFKVIHRASKSLNVAVAYSSILEKEKLINYCKEKNLEYTECPRYIRVKEQAISIEIKRLEVE